MLTTHSSPSTQTTLTICLGGNWKGVQEVKQLFVALLKNNLASFKTLFQALIDHNHNVLKFWRITPSS